MVLLEVKRSDKKNEFMYETTTKIPVEELIGELVELHNLRLKVQRLAMSCRELSKHGPIRPEETRGLSDSTTDHTPLDVNAYGKPTNPDQYGMRTGCPPPPEVADVLARTADEADAAVHHGLVTQRKAIDKKICQTHIDNMRGAVMIAYPAYHRLPAYDPTRLELENKEELDGASEYQNILEEVQTSVWWAGKELINGKLLADYVGKNEKTKIVTKLQPKSSGAPVREPRIDEDTHKAMLSYYYKKQEEQKKLEANDDDSYMDSQWANPKALKSQLVGAGGGNISWKAGR